MKNPCVWKRWVGGRQRWRLSSSCSGKVFGDLSHKPPPHSDPTEKLTLSLNSQLVD